MENGEKKCSTHEQMVVRLAQGDIVMASLQADSAEILECVKDMREKQNEFEKRMFVDNGSPCIQTRLIKLEQYQGVSEKHRRNHEKWLMLVGSVVLAGAGRLFFIWITG